MNAHVFFFYDSRKLVENKAQREVEVPLEVKSEGIHLLESFRLPVIHISLMHQEEVPAPTKPYPPSISKGILVI